MKKLLTLAVVAVMVTACGSKGLKVETPKTIHAEYGEELDNKLLFDVKKSDKNVEVKKVDGFDKLKLGEQKVKVTFSNGKEEVVKDIKINVEDTKAPIFKNFLKEIRIEKDAENVNIKDYFEVEDKSDIEININRDKVNFNKAGTYEIKVSSKDKHGNKSEVKKCTVIVVDSKEAEKHGLTATKEGYIPMSKETKKKGTNIKKAEEKIEQLVKEETGSKPIAKPNHGGNESKPSHNKHHWVAQYKTVHHKEKGHYEERVIVEAYDEKVTYEVAVGNQSGKVIPENIDPNEYIMDNNGDTAWHSEPRQKKVHHPAKYESFYVVDQKAYDEKVLTGYKCSCGATK